MRYRCAQPAALAVRAGDQECLAPEDASAASIEAFVQTIYLPCVQVRKRSWRVDARILRTYIVPVFGPLRFAGLTRGMVESWLYRLRGRGLAPSSCNRIFAVFRNLCSLAQEYGLLPEGGSPCAGIQECKVWTRRERYLSTAEARRLMAALVASPRQEAQALSLLLLTGARKNEILKARWEYVHLEQRLLTVPLSKSGKTRHILLSDEAVKVIRSLRRLAGCPWLFPGKDAARPLADLYGFWNTLRRKVGLGDVRIHDLRHSFASLLVNAGHSLYEVQHLLGHSTPRTTMRYAHLGQERLRAAAEAVSACLTLTGGRRKDV